MSAVRIPNPTYILRATPRSPGKFDQIIISLGGVRNYKFQDKNDLVFAFSSHDAATKIKSKLLDSKYVKHADLVKRNPRKKRRGLLSNPSKNINTLNRAEKWKHKKSHAIVTVTSIGKINNKVYFETEDGFQQSVDFIKFIEVFTPVNDNPIAHFPHTKRGRPRKGPGRPAKYKHTGKVVFPYLDASGHSRDLVPRASHRQQKTRLTSKKKRGRPIKNDYWILDCYIKGILIATYIGEGAKSTAMREASEMLNTSIETYGQIIGKVGIIDKVELAGPYPREDGKPTPQWPRL